MALTWKCGLWRGMKSFMFMLWHPHRYPPLISTPPSDVLRPVAVLWAGRPDHRPRYLRLVCPPGGGPWGRPKAAQHLRLEAWGGEPREL